MEARDFISVFLIQPRIQDSDSSLKLSGLIRTVATRLKKYVCLWGRGGVIKITSNLWRRVFEKFSKLSQLLQNGPRIALRTLVRARDIISKIFPTLTLLLKNGLKKALGRLVKAVETFFRKYFRHLLYFSKMALELL